MRRAETLAVYAAPLAVTVLSIAGLTFALLGNGGWDALSCLLLALTLLVGVRKAVGACARHGADGPGLLVDQVRVVAAL